MTFADIAGEPAQRITTHVSLHIGGWATFAVILLIFMLFWVGYWLGRIYAVLHKLNENYVIVSDRDYKQRQKGL